MDHTQVIIRPVVSEKSYVLATADKYTFRVHKDAHKTQIKQAVEELFDVHVLEVRTSAVPSKPKRRGLHLRAHARVEEGRRAGPRGRLDPDLPGPGGRSLMPIRKPKPTSPGRRFVTYADFAEVTKTKPEKSLVEGLKKSGGRNANGRKTARHRGGGAKRLYRMIDFKRRKDGVPARVAAIEYDPNRSAYIALLHYVRRREELHPRPEPAARRHDRRVRARRRHHRRQRAAAGQACRSAPSSTTSSSSPAAAASSPARPAPASS